MCAYGLKCPLSKLPIQKGTGLIASSAKIKQALRRCPGCTQHKTAARSEGGVSICEHAGRYTPQFVKAMYGQLGPEAQVHPCALTEPVAWSELQCECLASDEDQAVAEPDANTLRKVGMPISAILLPESCSGSCVTDRRHSWPLIESAIWSVQCVPTVGNRPHLCLPT